MYHIRGIIQYSTSSANSSVTLSTANYTGQSWVRRIEERNESGSFVAGADQFEYTDGRLLAFGYSMELTNTAGSVTIDMTLIKNSNRICVLSTFHHTGANSSGMSTGQFGMSYDGSIPITFSSPASSRTFSNANFLVTGAI